MIPSASTASAAATTFAILFMMVPPWFGAVVPFWHTKNYKAFLPIKDDLSLGDERSAGMEKAVQHTVPLTALLELFALKRERIFLVPKSSRRHSGL